MVCGVMMVKFGCETHRLCAACCAGLGWLLVDVAGVIGAVFTFAVGTLGSGVGLVGFYFVYILYILFIYYIIGGGGGGGGTNSCDASSVTVALLCVHS